MPCQERNERPEVYHDEERKTSYPGNLPYMRHQDVQNRKELNLQFYQHIKGGWIFHSLWVSSLLLFPGQLLKLVLPCDITDFCHTLNWCDSFCYTLTMSYSSGHCPLVQFHGDRKKQSGERNKCDKAKSQWEISSALDVTSGNIGEVGQWRDVGYRLSSGRERPLT